MDDHDAKLAYSVADYIRFFFVRIYTHSHPFRQARSRAAILVAGFRPTMNPAELSGIPLKIGFSSLVMVVLSVA